MKLGKVDHSTLLAEKTLWQVFKASLAISESRFNAWVIAASYLLGGTYSISANGKPEIILLLQKQAELGFNSAVQLLGFLIAGFTIFVACSKPLLLVAMVKFKEKPTGLPRLKYTFFLLTRVFVWLLTFAAFELVVIFFGQENGAAGLLIPDTLIDEAAGATLAIAAALWATVFVQLKSFVYNIYAFSMAMVKFDVREYNKSQGHSPD